MTQPKVSVIVPCYENEASITRCLRSLQQQTLTEIEVIVVDDGSTDETVKVVLRAIHQDLRFQLLQQPSNGGVHVARWRGVQAATGEYIGFVDGDDTVAAEMYRVLYTACQDSDADVAMCGMYRVNEITDEVTTRVRYRERLVVNGDLFARFCRLEFQTGSLCNRLYKSALIKAKSAWSTGRRISVNEDCLVNFYVFHRALRAVMLPEMLYHAYENLHSATRRRSAVNLTIEILKAYCEALRMFPGENHRCAVDEYYGKVLRSNQFAFAVDHVDGSQQRGLGELLSELAAARPCLFLQRLRAIPHSGESPPAANADSVELRSVLRKWGLRLKSRCSRWPLPFWS